MLLAACEAGPPLVHAQPSAESLGTALLGALAANDRTRLEDLAVNEDEFRRHVWPDLPAARPERKLPFSYVWGDLHQKSGASLSQILERHGSRRYRLKRIAFASHSQYRHYLIHREATFEVLDDAGNPAALRLCGSVLEKDDAWKVFSYVIDD